MTDTSWQTGSQPPNASALTSRHGHHLFYGWRVVLTAMVAVFWGVPITVYSFSVFLKPLIQDFHSTRAAVSLAYTLRSIADAICTPFVGWLIARFGTRRVILPSAVMFGLILLSIRVLSGGIGQFYVSYVAFALAASIGFGPLAYGNVVSFWFDRRRGLALGLTMLGIGCGAMIMPPFAQRLIANFGWRNAYAILGVAVLLIPVPIVAAFLKEKPEDLGLLPDGVASADSPAPARHDASGLTASEAWRSPAFWLIVSSFFLVGASVQGCIVHTAAMLNDRGVGLQGAALGSSLLGAAVMIGRVGTGYLLDRLFAARVAAWFFVSVAAGIGLFVVGAAPRPAFLGAFLIGLGLGAEVDMIPYLVSRYFGLRSFAQIYSVVLATFILSGAVGPLLMGWSFDLTRSYRASLIAFLAATLSAALLITRLGPYRYRASDSRQSGLARQES
jgi:MFS family permease